jgi:orotidine-5'-phosphate decarboxylase
MNTKIIVALDYDSKTKALDMARQLNPEQCRLKIGKELFTICGPNLIHELQALGFDTFLDLKFHDIPNTVYNAVRAAISLRVWMVNVHACGGREMLQQARKAINESEYKPLLIAVTVLTSIGELDFAELGYRLSLKEQVLNFAKLSYECGLDGVVCSAHEALAVKEVTSKATTKLEL